MATNQKFPSIGKPITNGAIAAELLALAQLLTVRGENPFKIKAYRRAAKTLRMLSESVDEIVRHGGDLTQYPGIGSAIQAVIQEIVQTGSLRQLDRARSEIGPE